MTSNDDIFIPELSF